MHKLTALIIGFSVSSSALGAGVTVGGINIDKAPEPGSYLIDRPSADRLRLNQHSQKTAQL